MGGEWPQVKLGDAINLKRGYDLPSKSRADGKIPVVSSSGTSGMHNEFKVKAPGVVTGRYGTIGQVHFIEEDFWPLNTTLYVQDFKGNLPRFINYLLQTINYQQFSDKAAVPGVNRNDLHEASIQLPPLEEQRAIAHILGTLDDKIELNRKQNETLEAMAQAIFKAWFVDFEPVRAKIEGRWQRGQSLPGLPAHLYDLFPDRLVESELGEIPEGWTCTPLDEIADYLNGLALQKFRPEDGDADFLPVLKIAQLRKGFADGEEKASVNIKPEYIVDNGDVVFSWSGSLLVDIWSGGKAALNQHLFKVTSEKHPKWLYYCYTKHHLEEFQRIASYKAVTMGHIKRSHLKEALCAIPPAELLKELSSTMESIIEKIIEVRLENNNLAQLRDTLLPKLISGELSVAAIK